MASAADADDAAPPAEFPSLPRELVAVVFEYIPIPMLRKAALVSRDWAAALQVDEVWHRMVLRRYALDESRAALGVLLPTWKETFIFLSEHRVPEFEMAPKFSHSCHGGLIELWATGEKARKFLLGIARGFMPTHDGLFTHHEERATPVHYRHTLGDDPLSGYSRDDGTQGYRDEKLREGLGLRKGGLRFGGVWEWSCDRVVWFPVSTTIISRGIFARSGEWSLVRIPTAVGHTHT